ncbi:hypothetical protein BGZ50_009216 [Haplosporangium sp. Z 11]|nr:hypothetical protein BGZ50_009216 [Haplosporangium sp. Z 11]
MASAQAVTGAICTCDDLLSIRASPSASAKIIESLKDGAKVNTDCTAHGTTATGKYGTLDLWGHALGGHAISNISSRRNNEYNNVCDKITARAYVRGYSGFISAWVHRQQTPTRCKHSSDCNAPAGALVLWQGGK